MYYNVLWDIRWSYEVMALVWLYLDPQSPCLFQVPLYASLPAGEALNYEQNFSVPVLLPFFACTGLSTLDRSGPFINSGISCI